MGFQFDEKGWAHITPLGEFEHAGAGVVQVIDAEAAKAMVDDFKAKASADNFPGILVDFDHFSMDTDKPSEAAGWICDLRQDSNDYAGPSEQLSRNRLLRIAGNCRAGSAGP